MFRKTTVVRHQPVDWQELVARGERGTSVTPGQKVTAETRPRKDDVKRTNLHSDENGKLTENEIFHALTLGMHLY
jgi:hypothetical protein